MYLEFMKAGLWDALVVAITVIGLALAAAQLARNHASYRQQQDRGEDSGNHRS